MNDVEAVLMDPDDFPFPERGDRLFESGLDHRYNIFTKMYSDKWHLFADGYQRAADIIIEHIEDHLIDREKILYPVAFLYRQSMELWLKIIITNGNKLLDIDTENSIFIHDLEKLWGRCLPIIETIWPDGDKSVLSAAGETISQFRKIDPYSMSFRYPEDKRGEQTIPNELDRVNLINLAEVANKLCNLLSSISGAVSDYLGDKLYYEDAY